MCRVIVKCVKCVLLSAYILLMPTSNFSRQHLMLNYRSHTSRPLFPSSSGVADVSDLLSSVVGVFPIEPASPLSELCFSDDDDAVSAALNIPSSSELSLCALCLPVSVESL